ncbi:prepilin peptidase [archaeon]|nr:prepilin peptidase [archaeon]
MVEELFVLLALGGAIAASITDIKSRLIPNKLTFSLIGAGIFGYLAFGVLRGDFSMFFASIKSLGVMFAIGYLFWMLGAWSAGDAKEFLFIAVLVPVYPAFLYTMFNPHVAGYPFIITVFVNTLLAIFPLVFVYSIYLALKKGIFSGFLEPAKDPKKFLEAAFVITAAISISSIFLGRIMVLLALLLLYRIERKYRLLLSLLLIVAYIILTSGSLYLQTMLVLTNFAVVFFLIFALSLMLNSINILRSDALVEASRITKLSDGDIIAEEIYIAGDKVVRDERSMVEKIKDAAKTGSLGALHRRGIGTGAAGVTDEDIELLKGYVEKGLLEDPVKVKKSMPFAPVVLVGLVAAFVIGDVMLAIRVWLYG